MEFPGIAQHLDSLVYQKDLEPLPSLARFETF